MQPHNLPERAVKTSFLIRRFSMLAALDSLVMGIITNIGSTRDEVRASHVNSAGRFKLSFTIRCLDMETKLRASLSVLSEPASVFDAIQCTDQMTE